MFYRTITVMNSCSDFSIEFHQITVDPIKLMNFVIHFVIHFDCLICCFFFYTTNFQNVPENA